MFPKAGARMGIFMSVITKGKLSDRLQEKVDKKSNKDVSVECRFSPYMYGT